MHRKHPFLFLFYSLGIRLPRSIAPRLSARVSTRLDQKYSLLPPRLRRRRSPLLERVGRSAGVGIYTVTSWSVRLVSCVRRGVSRLTIRTGGMRGSTTMARIAGLDRISWQTCLKLALTPRARVFPLSSRSPPSPPSLPPPPPPSSRALETEGNSI